MLDEPTTGLDEFNEENILSKIKDLKKDKIILMSFHNLKHKKYCDYLVKINYNNKVELIKN
jgi:ABC-type multidrug transport system ATPase subunit